MQIRYGCELSLLVDRFTPTFCLVDVYPERRKDILEEIPLEAKPVLSFKESIDCFGNLVRRCTLPPGETVLSMGGVISDSGRPDHRDAGARALPIVDLPDDVTVF